jgi:hypothetical protein
MSEVEQDQEGVYSRVRFGWLDYLPKLPNPVFAWPGTELWRVMLHGHGFIVHTEDANQRIVGFFTTHFVPARNRQEAIQKALLITSSRWKGRVKRLRSTG